MKYILIPFALTFLGTALNTFSEPTSSSNQPAQEETNKAPEAFLKLQKKISSLAPQTREEWDGEFSAYIQKVKGLLSDFAKKYPGTEEAYEARFQVIDLIIQLDGDTQAGIKMLRKILRETKGKESQKELHARALITIGNVQMQSKDFANAKKTFASLKKAFPETPYAMMAEEILKEIQASEKLAPGNPLIHFEVLSLDGKKISPKYFRGKVLLVDFWATWCGPCRTELPHVKEVYEAFKDQGFVILGISLDNNKEKLQNFLKKHNITWFQYFDGKIWENKVAQIYRVQAIPMTLLVDRNGKIRYRNLPSRQLKKKVAELLAETS